MNAKLSSAIAQVSRRLHFKLYDHEDARNRSGLDIRFCSKKFRSRVLGTSQLFANAKQFSQRLRRPLQAIAVESRRPRSSLKHLSQMRSPGTSVVRRRLEPDTLTDLTKSNLKETHRPLLNCSSTNLCVVNHLWRR